LSKLGEALFRFALWRSNRRSPPLRGIGVGVLHLFVSLLFGGLSRVVRQPIVKMNYLVTDISGALSVGAKLEQHFGSSHVAA
jgi:hypothetical protein